MSLIEMTAAAFGVVCVALFARQNVWAWPTGLVQVGLFVYVFYEARLYADFGLHIVYVGLQLYGWYHWVHGRRDDRPLPVSRLAPAAGAGWLAGAAAGTAGLGYALGAYTNADYPYWDSAIAVLSLVAQYLIAHKVLENWLFWIVVNVLGIGLYGVKGLYPTTALYCVFLVLAVWGYVTWRRALSAAAPA
jgi:nicotinamide mononucleotide transporter